MYLSTTITVLAYWRRRTPQPYTYPVKNISDTEVLTPTEYEAQYSGLPKITGDDGGWNAITEDAGIDDQLGLCGDMHEIHMLCDAMYISAAIHQHLGMTLDSWDECCMWKKNQLDGHSDDDANYYFHTIGSVYGEDAESAARRQYAK